MKSLELNGATSIFTADASFDNSVALKLHCMITRNVWPRQFSTVIFFMQTHNVLLLFVLIQYVLFGKFICLSALDNNEDSFEMLLGPDFVILRKSNLLSHVCAWCICFYLYAYNCLMHSNKRRNLMIWIYEGFTVSIAVSTISRILGSFLRLFVHFIVLSLTIDK